MQPYDRPFSLLAPAGKTGYVTLSETTANDLSLDLLTEKLSPVAQEQTVLKRILMQLPVDREIIEYRRAVYTDLKKDPALCRELGEIFDRMQFSTSDTMRTSHGKAGIWELIQRLRELENYSTSVRRMQELFAGKNFGSEGMRQLADHVESLCRSSGFAALSEDVKVLADDVAGIRSMTLGINFNSEFAPAEAGIISLNSYAFTEKGFLEKYMQFHRKRHPEDTDLQPFTILSHASNAPDNRDMLMNNLTNLIEEMLPQLTGKLRRVLRRYADTSGSMLGALRDETVFYLRCMELEQRLTAAGRPCCMPDFSEDDTCLSDLYNVRLALWDETLLIVCNDLRFAGKQRIFLLTGPNRGGKTIYTQGIGLAFLLFQQGVFVPCRSGKLRICDGIFTHFPADENQTLSLGRLGEEAERFSEICKAATPDSLLLCNESFATTSHSESLYIAQDVLKYLCCLGARTCFNTHMLELAEHPELLQSEDAVCEAVSLVMGKRDTPDAFRVRCDKPDGRSYAREIASRYGITFEQLRENRQQ